MLGTQDHVYFSLDRVRYFWVSHDGSNGSHTKGHQLHCEVARQPLHVWCFQHRRKRSSSEIPLKVKLARKAWMSLSDSHEESMIFMSVRFERKKFDLTTIAFCQAVSVWQTNWSSLRPGPRMKLSGESHHHTYCVDDPCSHTPSSHQSFIRNSILVDHHGISSSSVYKSPRSSFFYL